MKKRTFLIFVMGISFIFNLSGAILPELLKFMDKKIDLSAEESYELYMIYLEKSENIIIQDNDILSEDYNFEDELVDEEDMELSELDTSIKELKKNQKEIEKSQKKFFKIQYSIYAENLLKNAADKGMAKAQYEYAVRCLKKNNEENNKLAIEYLVKAAEQEYVPAYKELAYCYRKGIGTPTDKKKAKSYEHLYKKSEKK